MTIPTTGEVHVSRLWGNSGWDTTVMASIASACLAAIGTVLWPIGSVYVAVVSTDPATLLGFGTWARIAEGRMLVGQNSGDADFDTAEETGGAKTHTLTTNELPSHAHSLALTGGVGLGLLGGGAASGVGTTGNTGGGAAHNNMPPYLVVYIWKRTA